MSAPLAPLPLITSQVARALKLSEHRTRQLADRGLLRVQRTESGIRLYDPADVARLVRERAARRGEQ